jgi:hypothetical protein
MLITPITSSEKAAAVELHSIWQASVVDADRCGRWVTTITVPERLRMLWRNLPGEPYVYRTVEVRFTAAPVRESLRQQIGRVMARLKEEEICRPEHSPGFYDAQMSGLKLAFDLAVKDESEQMGARR